MTTAAPTHEHIGATHDGTRAACPSCSTCPACKTEPFSTTLARYDATQAWTADDAARIKADVMGGIAALDQEQADMADALTAEVDAARAAADPSP